MNIAALIKDVKSETHGSTIDVNELLRCADLTKNDFLKNQTLESISKNVLDSLIQLKNDVDNKQCDETVTRHFNRLTGYRFVDELHLLHKGKYVRWIRHDCPDKLMKGAVVVDIQFGDFGANILCRLMNGDFLRYRFDKCNTYQKLTAEEELILMFATNYNV